MKLISQISRYAVALVLGGMLVAGPVMADKGVRAANTTAVITGKSGAMTKGGKRATVTRTAILRQTIATSTSGSI